MAQRGKSERYYGYAAGSPEATALRKVNRRRQWLKMRQRKANEDLAAYKANESTQKEQPTKMARTKRQTKGKADIKDSIDRIINVVNIYIDIIEEQAKTAAKTRSFEIKDVALVANVMSKLGATSDQLRKYQKEVAAQAENLTAKQKAELILEMLETLGPEDRAWVINRFANQNIVTGNNDNAEGLNQYTIAAENTSE